MVILVSGKKKWKTGELAKLTGLTIRTLRYYDQIELFSPSDYSESGYRLYNATDLSRLQQILSLKDLGLTLEEIKSILADDTYNPIEVVTLQIERLRENIRVQQKLLKDLQNVSEILQTKETLTVQDFTNSIGMMKKSHENYFYGRQKNMECQFDRLGEFLSNHPSHQKRRK
ncbi:MerR family transcriptional regulator [Bacillus sp. CGMCC 1.60114]|uniref:MerR family transcriptional regulator n=1 Tax=unclassified Bacillus (in: firmicutes) TaxID=185979 RepID=UPI00363E0C35